MATEKDLDTTPFLHDTQNDDLEITTSKPERRRLWSAVLIHAAIAITYTIVITALVLRFVKPQVVKDTDERTQRVNGGQYTPAHEAVSFKAWQLDPANFSGNPFVGDPRPEHDEAWNGLMQNIHLRITPDEYEKVKPQIDRETAQLANGQGYIVGLGVYHELHCLKWIRHWIHRDIYWPELEGEALEERKWHIEHCLELFRLNTMCDASLAISTYDWLSVDPPQLTPHQHGMYQRKCVDWDRLDAWSTGRRVDILEPGILQPPEHLEPHIFDR
ncbi:hypothetical protein BDV96DRAFT_510950 [Lophiotrema nucula]|uniref:Tat pathway signal sequence n=1 Tax=Lophiotrema nucula TaxID=690887 RepID=A0A6A5ZWR5_9PLEO|nr:hypothetical protein BDV96DRAFT_510950 [Lophiotrema nucula]